MLAGIKLFDLKRFVDERGSFTEIMRYDWFDLFDDDKPVQANLSISFPNIVRAWHKHERGQIDYFIVIKGTVKICAFDEVSGELDEFVVSGDKLQVVRIPGKYWHGTKTVGVEPSVTIYFVSKLYDYNKPDELRRPWNDKNIVPKLVNGKTDDIRVGKPWDWFMEPHK
ncbi:MAG: dTDP-4-dehydrorhamnose 3,5-epimerase family protein [Candidatus Aenigmatarchaeota archaeon]